MRYFLHLAYNGSAFFGWQIQPEHPSVQETLEKALGIPVVMWMNLQSQYDKDIASQKVQHEDVVITIPVSDRNLLRDLSRKFGWACML